MKNKKSILFNSLVLLFSILTFVFLAFPAIEGASGYELLSFVFEGFPMGIPVLFLTALMGLLLIDTVLVLLCDFNVIKNEKFARVVNAISYYLAIFVLFLYLVVLSSVISYVAMDMKFGWANFVNIVINIAAGVLVVINQKVFRK